MQVTATRSIYGYQRIAADLACRNATAEGVKIRKLRDDQGFIFEYMKLVVNYPIAGLKQARQLAQAERVKMASNIDHIH